MTYIDTFIAAVPTVNKEKYRQHAEDAAAVFKKFGAVQLIECWGDDVPHGEVTDFYKAVKANEDETIVLSCIFWPDKATRDAGTPKAFGEMKTAGADLAEMPFDGSRVILGGFETILEV
ncbi:MAG: DUF1428 domain-containing protein [Pseudomonadota bacterium]